MSASEPEDLEGRVAIVGLAGRFPGAGDVRALWRALCAGREAIRRLSPEELARAGVPPELSARPDYVPVTADLAGIEGFDAPLFGLSAREATVTDPQQRLLLELAWEVFEDAGHRPGTSAGAVGVFVGASRNDWLHRVLAAGGHLEALGAFALDLTTSRDFLATRLAYVFDLAGPALTVQTACSTSLVAVHLACQSLIAGECDLALAGGVSVRLPQAAGYLWVEGGVASPDGHCRAFDARAAGTVAGNGGALVALRRLADALADGDRVIAVIGGTAVNNDGARKVGFTAPSVDRQAAVIEEALAIAGCDPATIGYVEAHGTGTPLGDPIEVAALARAFAPAGGDGDGDCGSGAGGDGDETGAGATAERARCLLGSIKTNLGHLDAAAGVAGLVKAALCVRAGRVPPSLGFETPNPALRLEATPFAVATALSKWPLTPERAPRRAGVSSFGIGGTNAHAVLEAPPAPAPRESDTRPRLALLSARTEAALARRAVELAERLERAPADADRDPELDLDPDLEFDADEPPLELRDVAWTLAVGRRALGVRRAVVARSVAQLARLVRASGARSIHARPDAPTAFLLPGQGAQVPHMTRGLAHADGCEAFRAELARCGRHLATHDLDLLALLDATDGALDETAHAQPALLAVELALAAQWRAWGVEPALLCGHSLGEWTAACLAGVLPVEAALDVVVARGRLMQAAPAGAMVAVSASEAELAELLVPETVVASVNAPRLCVAAGPEAAIARLEERLEHGRIAFRRLATRRAFHTPAMEAAADAFERALARVPLAPPERPFVSNVTGTWITSEQATDPAYWAEQLRRPVRLADGLATLAAEAPLWLEVGPGRSFAAPVRALTGAAVAGRIDPGAVVASMPRPGEAEVEARELLGALGELWCRGASFDARAVLSDASPRRVALPTYPFERERHWIDAAPLGLPDSPGSPGAPGSSVRSVAGAASAADSRARAAERAGSAPLDSAEIRAPEVSTAAPLADATQEAVAAVWREVLGVASVVPTDDFLALGGSSLLAVSVLAKLRERGAPGLALADVLTAPSLAELAARVEAARAAGATVIPRGPLVELGAPPAADSARRRESPPAAKPLVCVPGLDGEVAAFVPLARALGARSVVALRPPGLDAGTAPLADVKALAEHFLGALRARRLPGPWRLLGHSFGGLVALELARALRAAGERVATLVLVDCRRPELPADDPARTATDRELRAAAEAELVTAGLLAPDAPAAERERRVAVAAAHARALAAWRPARWPGDLDLVLASDSPADPDPDRARRRWAPFVDGALRVHALAGDHRTILVHGAAALAALVAPSRPTLDPSQDRTP